jgi:hypothetical protein
MSYGLIYTVPFSSNNGVPYQVNIEKEGYTGESTELQGAASPFTVEINEPDNDFRYYPFIGSTAKIKLVGNDYLTSLYSDNYLEYRVTLLKNGTVIWCGFIKPENYTQDYNDEIFELEIDCVSAMNILQYIDYSQQGEDEKIFLTFWGLLKYILNSAPSNYQAVYIPHVYSDNAADYASYDNVLQKIKISEANFFDDLNNTTKIIDDKGTESTISNENPWKIRDVLEEMSRFLHWTCVDWCGSLYFIDPDWSGEYLKYTADLSTYTVVQYPTALNVKDLGSAGSNNTLDILPGYNKVTIKTSNYNAGDIFPTESYDDLAVLETDDYSHNNDRCRKKFLLPSNFHPILIDSKYNEITDLKSLTNRNTALGAQLIKRANYAVDKNGNAVERGTSTPYTNYSYEDLIQINVWDPYTTYAIGAKPVLFEFTGKLPCAAYSDGAISINMSVQEAYLDGILSWGDKIPDTPTGQSPLPNFIFLLKIGDYYWNGTVWTTKASTFSLQLNYDDTYTNDGGFLPIQTNKTLSMPYNGMDGYIIPLPDSPVFGELKFQLVHIYTIQPNIAYNLLIKDLKLSYQLKDDYYTEGGTDRVYENIIEGNFASELDEIEEKISSYNYDGLCYSKVLLNNVYLTDNLYCALDEATVRPEEKLIKRIINFYSAIKIKLTQVLQESDSITPLSTFTDNYMSGKTFSMLCGSIDFEDDSFTVIMLEQ